MTDLFENLRPASFRGVPFQVDGSDMETGRRVQVHEYPQQEPALGGNMMSLVSQFQLSDLLDAGQV